MLKSRYSPVESIKIMGHASKKAMGPNIEVLLWNVFKCQKKGWQRDFETLIDGKDLILFQESILNSPFDSQFTQSIQHQWMMARSFKHLKTNIETGVKTGSTVAASKHSFSASLHAEPLSNTKKMLLATEYPLLGLKTSAPEPEQSLLVVNTHMINFVTFKKFKAHLDQVFETLEHHTGPLILAGDFNTWNGKRLKYFNLLAKSCLLEEAKMLRQPRFNHLFQHLDHLYYRGLEAINAHVHTDIHSSDHYPISLSLRLILNN